jgi:hypothetical protein
VIASATGTSTVHSSPLATQGTHTPAPAAAYCTAGDIIAIGFSGATYTPECGGSYTGTSGGLYSTASSYALCLLTCDNDQNNCVSFSFLLTTLSRNCYVVYDSSAAPVADPNVDSGTVSG